MRPLYLLLGALVIWLVIYTLSDSFSPPSTQKLNSWAIDQIKKDLSIFSSKKFSRQDLAETYNNLRKIDGNQLIKFQIIKGNIYSNYKELDRQNAKLVSSHNALIKFFAQIIKIYDFNQDVEFIVSTGNNLEAPNDYVFKAPIIAPVKNQTSDIAKYLVLAPDSYTLGEWPRVYVDILKANEKYPWTRKIEKAFWRGSTNGVAYTRENWESFPRVKLVQLSLDNPSLIDAKFTSFNAYDNDSSDMVAEKYPLAIAISQSDHVKYKIQIALEGGARSLSGELWRLLSNSSILKQKSNNVQWFYPILKEGEHYINIEPDMSDMLDKIKWLLNNDAEAKKSAFSSSALIKKEITPEHLYLYWIHLLNEYSEAQNFDLTKPTLAKAIEIK